jgi:hypothetical protein
MVAATLQTFCVAAGYSKTPFSLSLYRKVVSSYFDLTNLAFQIVRTRAVLGGNNLLAVVLTCMGLLVISVQFVGFGVTSAS